MDILHRLDVAVRGILDLLTNWPVELSNGVWMKNNYFPGPDFTFWTRVWLHPDGTVFKSTILELPSETVLFDPPCDCCEPIPEELAPYRETTAYRSAQRWLDLF